MKLATRFGRRRDGEGRRVVHFFEAAANCVFVVIVGLFATLFLSVLGASVLFFRPIYNQLAIFSLLGIVCFSLSYRRFLRLNGRFLRNLTYENFLISRRKLFSWVLHTFNFYFLLAWFTLIILGSTNGFNILFPTEDSREAFIVTDAYTTRILGFVLLCVHVFLVLLIRFVAHYWARIFSYAAREFERRRRVLEEVRSKVRKS